MSRRLRPALAILLLGLLAVPLPASAARDPGPGTGQSPAFDTPAPTPTPAPVVTPPPKQTKPETVKKPKKKPKPTKEPTPAQIAPPAAALAPVRTVLDVGVPPDTLGQAPLILASERGFFEDAGFTEVSLVETEDALAGLASGELDFAVVDTASAAAASAADPSMRVVAGYRNYAGEDGAYGGDVLMATPRLVADEPSTVTAFTSAYVRALEMFQKSKRAEKALSDIEAGGAAVDRSLRRSWSDAIDAYAPFDGGFGSRKQDAGWGELSGYLADPEGNTPDLEAIVAQHTLNISQAALDLPSNPVSAWAGKPGVTKISVGVLPGEDAIGPIAAALDAGYFKDAGFSSVEIVDVEAPTLGVLQGELDFAVVDAVDAADGASQGLPLKALAGHRNYATDGTYGGDLLAASTDLIEQEPSTVGAFVVAYLRGLQDIAEDDPEAGFAPHDGGFGDRAQGDGLAELQSYLDGELGAGVDLAGLIDDQPLEYAQAWWGLPANPVNPAPSSDASASEENE